jgi:hypothetical protein
VADGDVIAVHGGQNGVGVDLGPYPARQRQGGERNNGCTGKKLLHRK